MKISLRLCYLLRGYHYVFRKFSVLCHTHTHIYIYACISFHFSYSQEVQTGHANFTQNLFVLYKFMVNINGITCDCLKLFKTLQVLNYANIHLHCLVCFWLMASLFIYCEFNIFQIIIFISRVFIHQIFFSVFRSCLI